MSLDVILLGVVHQNAKGHPFLSLIGRASSRASSVDLNAIMGQWGGGGHPAASAASLRLTGVEEAAVRGLNAADDDEGRAAQRHALEQMEAEAFRYLARAR